MQSDEFCVPCDRDSAAAPFVDLLQIGTHLAGAHHIHPLGVYAVFGENRVYMRFGVYAVWGDFSGVYNRFVG